MTQAIGVHSTKTAVAILEEKPCYIELAERIAAIWKAVCDWISEWVSALFSPPEHNLAKRCPNAFYSVMNYFSPKEVATCETVCKAWKMPEKVWKAQGATYGVTSTPVSGCFKDLFKVPKMAFGPREWVKYGWGEPGPMPSLLANIAATAAKLQETYTLTLIPATVDGQPLSFDAFVPLAKKSNLPLYFWPQVEEKYGNETVGKSLWVWMQKNIEPESRGMTQAQAEIAYPNKLGKALWITVSVVAHYARYKISLFTEGNVTRTCDGGTWERSLWSTLIGNNKSALTIYAYLSSTSEKWLGVANTFPAEVETP